MSGLAAIAQQMGDGDIRLTVWQNLLISGVPDGKVEAAKAAIEALGLDWKATSPRAGLVACTGNAGCKFSASNTKGHALRLADYLEARLAIDLPVNIHLTGCHHSCAQHYVGDIGLLAHKVERGEEMVEGYHVYVGGGAASTNEQAMAREYALSVAFDELPPLIERLLAAWLVHRQSPAETFFEFCRRHEIVELRELAGRTPLWALAA